MVQGLRGCGILRDSEVLVQGLRGFGSGNQRVWFRDSEGVDQGLRGFGSGTQELGIPVFMALFVPPTERIKLFKKKIMMIVNP